MTYSIQELEALELEVKKHPSDSSRYVNLADVQLALNKVQQAFSTYRAAKAICPDDSLVMCMGAKVFEALDKREEAIDCLQKALKTEDQKVYNADNISHLAELLYNSGKKELALSWLKKLVEVSSDNPEILIRLAQIHLSVGNILESQKYLKIYKDKFGSTREMYSLMGETMLARGFYDGAVKNYQDAVTSFKDDADMHLGLGKAWIGMGDTENALKELSAAIRVKPDDINILLELGKLQSEMGMLDKADETFSQIDNSNLKNGEILLDIAKHFIQSKKDNRALYYLEKALTLSPFHPEILELLAKTCLKMKKYEQALEVFSKASQADNNSVWAYEGIVLASEAIGNYKEKVEAQKKLLSLKKATAEDWCDYGESLIKLGNFEGSQDAFENAAKIDPSCLRAYQAPEIIKLEKARAEGEKIAKKAEEALEKRFYLTATERLEKALSLVPNNISWTKSLAKVALKTADLEKASQLLSSVRRAEPDNFEFGYELARTYECLNNLKPSVDLLTSLIKNHPFELKAHLMLLRLKRTIYKGVRVSADMLDSIIKNIETELGGFKRESTIPQMVKGYAYYIFSYRSSFEVEALRNAENCFLDVLKNFGEVPEANFGLALIERTRGSLFKAIEYMKKYIDFFPNSNKSVELAKMYENFGKYDEARKIYGILRDKYPENGYYRKKYIENTAYLQNKSGKNELTMLLSQIHKNILPEGGSIWPIYETAIGQEMASKEGNLSDEWLKRSMLSWRKAESHPDFNYWALWEMIRSKLENSQGIEKTKFASSFKNLVEKNIREMPDYAGGYLSMARCLLAYNDLTNNDKALNYLEKAWFIDQSSFEIGELLAKTAKSVGKSVIVDVVGYNVLLSEPEIANCIFKFQ